MKYCANCFLSLTKLQLSFDENSVCSACLNYWNRPNIDWKKRKPLFLNITYEINKNID
jgi:hypothetical protein